MKWLAADNDRKRETILYDGDCGMCHFWVKVVLKLDPGPEGFLFSPLQNQVDSGDLSSILVKRVDGTVIDRSRAILHILNRVGGIWRLISYIGRVCPRPLADLIYRGIARIRHNLFSKPKGLCPILPPELRERFILD